MLNSQSPSGLIACEEAGAGTDDEKVDTDNEGRDTDGIPALETDTDGSVDIRGEWRICFDGSFFRGTYLFL